MTDEERFRAMLVSHGRSIWRIARTYAGQAGEAEDLHQEILCQLWRSLPSFRGDSALGTWVYRVALNTALTYRRRSNRRPRVEAAADLADLPAETVGEPQAEAAILAAFLASLGAVDRSVMVLYMEGMGHAQIGEVLGLSAGAVAVRLHRLKQAFKRRCLEN